MDGYMLNQTHDEISLIKWNFKKFSLHIAVMLFILLTIFIKIIYYRSQQLAHYVPESLLLILIGIIFGLFVHYIIEIKPIKSSVWKLTPHLFFNYLLPPVILESSYSLYNRTFSEYLGLILLFAILGTVLNFFIIGAGMYITFKFGILSNSVLTFKIKDFFLFSSIIIAVDPVAVLAIFQDVGVELSLYFIVFGESLFNDGITLVLYEIMVVLVDKDVVMVKEIILGIVSFLTVSFGGLIIGVLFGILTCLITRVQSHLNSFTLILLAYFSYIMADCLGWSGIISMISCGLIQAAYAFHNLDKHNVIMVRHLSKLVSEISEAVIFLFLGIEVISNKLVWNTGFVLWSLFWCLISRALVVFLLTFIANYIQVARSKISITEQFIFFYVGLRGAVAFSLAVLIPCSKLGTNAEYNHQLLVTSTIVIILFTVGLMGMTIKPLVKLLKIRLKSQKELILFNSLNGSVLDEVLTSIENIVGHRGQNVIRDLFIRLDEKYFRKILQREPETYDLKMLKVYEKIALKLHYASIKPQQKIILKNENNKCQLENQNKLLEKNQMFVLLNSNCNKQTSSMIPKKFNSLYIESKPNNNNNNNNQFNDKTMNKIIKFNDFISNENCNIYRKIKRSTSLKCKKNSSEFYDLWRSPSYFSVIYKNKDHFDQIFTDVIKPKIQVMKSNLNQCLKQTKHNETVTVHTNEAYVSNDNF